MKKILISLLFVIFTPLNLIISLFILIELPKKEPLFGSFSPKQPPFFSSSPSFSGEISVSFTKSDARPVIIEKYLKKHHSPLLPYVNQILEASDKYNVDYRLIIAIAQCESNLCKKAPPESYNCWGFENGETRFLSWEQALNQVAKTLRERYLDKGLTTPELIMPKYAPPSVEKGGPWAKCVNQFMEELEYGKID